MGAEAVIYSRIRWYLLAVFSLLSAVECVVYFTFSSTPASSISWLGGRTTTTSTSNSNSGDDEQGNGTDEKTIDLLLNWGSIMFLVAALPTSWLCSRPNGLRHTLLIGSFFVLLACVVRLIPVVVFPSQLMPHAVYFAHLGQIINGLCGPAVMSTVSLLSGLWFPEHERVSATMIGWISNGLGFAIGFILGPSLAPTGSAFPRLLLCEAALSIIPFLCILLYFPGSPKQPVMSHVTSPDSVPINAAEQTPLINVVAISPALSPSNEKMSFVQGILKCLSNPTVLVAVLAGGITGGTSSAWMGILPQLFTTPEVGFSASAAGWIGFVAVMTSIVGCLVIGRVTDKWFSRHLKLIVCVTWAATLVPFAILVLSLPHPFQKSESLPFLFVSKWGLPVFVSLFNFFQSSLVPLYYEVAAESSFPIPESTSTGLATFIFSSTTIIMLFIAPAVGAPWFNVITLLVFSSCFLASLCLIHIKYNRHTL